MFKAVAQPIKATPGDTSNSSGGSSGSGGSTGGETVTLTQLGGIPVTLIGAPNGLPQLNSNSKIDKRFVDDNVANVIDKVSNKNISIHRLVVLDDNGYPEYADNSVRSHANRVVGISTTSALSGETLRIQHSGGITDPSFNFTVGPLFVGENGFLTSTPPDGTNATFSQLVGIATSPTELTMNLLTAYFLN